MTLEHVYYSYEPGTNSFVDLLFLKYDYEQTKDDLAVGTKV